MGPPSNDTVANLVCAQLLFLESEEADKDINLYINAPGGDITALFSIYDTMKYIEAGPVHLLLRPGGLGRRRPAGGGQLHGKRFAPSPCPHPLAPAVRRGVEGQASDIELQAREILRMLRPAQRDAGQPQYWSDRSKRCRRTPIATSS